MDKYFSTKQIASNLSVKPVTIRRWIIKGDLPAIKIGHISKEYRVAQRDLIKFLSERKTRK